MRKIAYLLALLFVLSNNSLIAQNDVHLTQSNPNLNFYQFINGVKYAYLEFEEEEVQKNIDKHGSVLIGQFAYYLQNLGFEYVAITTKEKTDLLNRVSSMCDITKVKIEVTMNKNAFTNHIMFFKSCLNDSFRFSASDMIYNDANVLNNLHAVWYKMHSTPIQYEERNRLNLALNQSEWTEDRLFNYFDSHPIDDLEGIYEKMMIGDPQSKSPRMGIKKDEMGLHYNVYYLSGANNYKDWVTGENLGRIIPTGTEELFKVNWHLPDKTFLENAYMTKDRTKMLYFTFSNDESTIHKYFKMFPKNQEENAEDIKATGSGVAISASGYIVTNYHVVEGGSFIQVEAKHNGINSVYNAVLVAKDPVNDLAILEINDVSFSGLKKIPYSLRTSLSDVGENVFTLSYPLTSTMGKELKLTDGVISSKTGYQSDVSSYQVSAPVQPGSSGGPLFDESGNLIGIIKAKHTKAENATYAIKVRNVLNLIELLPKRILLPAANSLDQMLLKDQVKALEEFVFLVKVLE